MNAPNGMSSIREDWLKNSPMSRIGSNPQPAAPRKESTSSGDKMDKIMTFAKMVAKLKGGG